MGIKKTCLFVVKGTSHKSLSHHSLCISLTAVYHRKMNWQEIRTFYSDSVQILKSRKPEGDQFVKGRHKPQMVRSLQWARLRKDVRENVALTGNSVKAQMRLLCLWLQFPWLCLDLNMIINIYLQPWGIKKISFLACSNQIISCLRFLFLNGFCK